MVGTESVERVLTDACRCGITVHMTATDTGYSIRVGDDRPWHGEYTKAEAAEAALRLAGEKFGNAQIRNNRTGVKAGVVREMKLRWIDG